MGLADQLAKITKGPVHVRTENGGAVLSLALHCLMVKDGFQPYPPQRKASIAPAANWNDRFEDEWVFEYKRKGYSSIFVLHCSLQATTGKMFVQAREKPSNSNMRNLGLQVSKYVPDLSCCKQPDWRGVLACEDVLEEMFKEYITGPLLEAAVPSDEVSTADIAREWLLAAKEKLSERETLIPLGIATGVVAVTLLAVYMRRRQ